MGESGGAGSKEDEDHSNDSQSKSLKRLKSHMTIQNEYKTFPAELVLCLTDDGARRIGRSHSNSTSNKDTTRSYVEHRRDRFSGGTSSKQSHR